MSFDWDINYYSGAPGAYYQTSDVMGGTAGVNYAVSNGKSTVIGCTNAAVLAAMGIADYYYNQSIPSVTDGYDSVQLAAHQLGSVQYAYGRPDASGYNSLVSASQSSGSDPVGSVFTSTGTNPDAAWITRINNWFTNKSIPLVVNGIYRNYVVATAYSMNYWMFTELKNRAGYAPIIAHYAITDPCLSQ